MNNDKKLYLYSGLAIVGALISYVAIVYVRKTPNNLDNAAEIKDAETTVSVTSTGEVIDKAQSTVPLSLIEILKKTSAQATTSLINKPIYTKLDDVKVRYSNYVNNGFISNIASSLTNTGTLIGNVVQVVEDKGKLKNNDGRIYKWFKIKPSIVAIEDMNRNKSFLTHVFSANLPIPFFVREDTIKLEK